MHANYFMILIILKQFSLIFREHLLPRDRMQAVYVSLHCQNMKASLQVSCQKQH